ncbi:MAG: hypothetical protein IOC49_01710 [Methylobacterium sp.]|nr:hypothetical protein [Methylobacterium sp.]
MIGKFITRLALCALTLACADLSAHAQAPSPVEWEIAHRYRLFRDEGHFREILKLYRELPEARRRNDPAMALEIALQKAAAERRLPRDRFGDPHTIERYGWASALLNETCFQSGNHGHYLCRLYAIDGNGEIRRDNRGRAVLGDKFMEPRTTDILVRLKEPHPNLANAICKWSAGTASATAPCGQGVRLPGLPFDQDFSIEVRLADNTLVGQSIGPQRARNLFIAGLGDSFGSGEGNPDKPAWLSGEIGYGSDYSGSSPLPNGRKRLYPTRAASDGTGFGGFGQPIWLNTQCHRSLYSQQVRASLAMALEQPHIAVTFTGYACTGAETHEGILGYWEARSDVPRRFRDDSPQLMRLLRDYCAEPKSYLALQKPGSFDWRSIRTCASWRVRPPDVVLLSIGGNDIGFARVIAGQTIGHHATRPPPLWNIAVSLWIKAADPLTFEEARANIAQLIPQNIKTLNEALAKHLRPAGGSPSFTLLQTGYPLLTSSSNGPCAASDDGMDVHAALKTKPGTGAEGMAFVRHFNGRLRDAVGQLSNPRWIFTDAHAELFTGHSICDRGAPPRSEFSETGYDPAISGSLDFPTTLRPTNVDRHWSPYKPDDWRAYRPRQRWFVTPNDGFLTGHYLNSGFPSQDKVQPLIAATLSGSFHPNALGHAATADVVLKELRQRLGLSLP